MTAQLFRLPAAYTGTHRVVVEEIDEYDHVNNTVYLQWLDRLAWAHSAKLGIPIEHCLAIRCGMAVRHTRVDYLRHRAQPSAARDGRDYRLTSRAMQV